MNTLLGGVLLRLARWLPRFRLSALLVAACGVASAASGGRSVVWDRNPATEGVVAYRVYSGSVSRHDPRFSGYSHFLDVGDATAVDAAQLECAPGVCYAAVTARNEWGLEGDYSSEVTLTARAWTLAPLFLLLPGTE